MVSNCSGIILVITENGFLNENEKKLLVNNLLINLNKIITLMYCNLKISEGNDVKKELKSITLLGLVIDNSDMLVAFVMKNMKYFSTTNILFLCFIMNLSIPI